MNLLVIIQKIWAIFAHSGGFYSLLKLAHYVSHLGLTKAGSNIKLGLVDLIPKMSAQYLF